MIKPTNDRIIIKRDEAATKSAGGIIMVSDDKKSVIGKVIAIGSSKKIECKVGDKILFGKYSGTEVHLEDEDLLVIRAEDLMGGALVSHILKTKEEWDAVYAAEKREGLMTREEYEALLLTSGSFTAGDILNADAKVKAWLRSLGPISLYSSVSPSPSPSGVES